MPQRNVVKQKVALDRLSAGQKQMLWRHIKKHHPALATLMQSAEVSTLKNTFDAGFLMDADIVTHALEQSS